MTDRIDTDAIRTATAYLNGHIDWQRQVWDLCDEVDRLRALADPAPVGLTEDEIEVLKFALDDECDHDPIRPDTCAYCAAISVIARLTAAPVDDRERVPEGWKVEWYQPLDATISPRLVPVSPSVDPEEKS